eukprot:scaffold7852_cov277-Pinguiococcus_pyrenoidosus.AAC.2
MRDALSTEASRPSSVALLSHIKPLLLMSEPKNEGFVTKFLERRWPEHMTSSYLSLLPGRLSVLHAQSAAVLRIVRLRQQRRQHQDSVLSHTFTITTNATLHQTLWQAPYLRRGCPGRAACDWRPLARLGNVTPGSYSEQRRCGGLRQEATFRYEDGPLVLDAKDICQSRAKALHGRLDAFITAVLHAAVERRSHRQGHRRISLLVVDLPKPLRGTDVGLTQQERRVLENGRELVDRLCGEGDATLY